LENFAMNKIDIRVGPASEALQGFLDTWKRAESGVRLPDAVPELLFQNEAEMRAAMTEKRIELLRQVARHEGLNIRQLAESLGRDYKNVHGDVSALLDWGLLEKDAQNKLVAPYDEVVLHVPLRQAA
jgi:predicted transcriptional regulator